MIMKWMTSLALTVLVAFSPVKAADVATAHKKDLDLKRANTVANDNDSRHKKNQSQLDRLSATTDELHKTAQQFQVSHTQDTEEDNERLLQVTNEYDEACRNVRNRSSRLVFVPPCVCTNPLVSLLVDAACAYHNHSPKYNICFLFQQLHSPLIFSQAQA